MSTKKIKKSSVSPPPPTSFSSLPYDVVFNILARISLIQYRPTLSLVSKSFQSLLTLRELYETRSRMGKTEDCIYVCLNLNTNNTNPRWFALAPVPKRQRLVPIPLFPNYDNLNSSTVVSVGSQIYLIGGYTKSSKSVFLLDCQSHQWRRLRNMIVPRESPTATVLDGKIYVTGGCSEYNNIAHSGEVYDLKTQTWKLLSTTTVHKLNLNTTYYGLVEIEKNFLCQISSLDKILMWRPLKENLEWSNVKGLESLYSNPNSLKYIILPPNSVRRRVTVLWKECRREGPQYKTDILCGEISFQRCGLKELNGFVEWSKIVFTLDGWDSSSSDFLLHSAIVTH